jgi:hypothetical protein
MKKTPLFLGVSLTPSALTIRLIGGVVAIYEFVVNVGQDYGMVSNLDKDNQKYPERSNQEAHDRRSTPSWSSFAVLRI